MTHLSGIIERLERASGPDRELDDEIAFAVLGDGGTVRLEGQPDDAPPMRTFTYLDGTRGTSLRYTSSIDVALTLVPEGWRVLQMDQYVTSNVPSQGNLWRCWLALFGDTVTREAFGGARPTLALSVCIAALIARSRSHKET